MSAPATNSGLLEIGKQCSHPSCGLVDFLPFKCSHCEGHFCQEHFKAETHNCTKYDEITHNRVAPNCPFCNIPIAIPPGQDPNIRMEQHFDKECSVTTGKEAKNSSKPRCARSNCRKVLFSPIRCEKCKEQFCPTHRFPADHNCSSHSPLVAKPASPNFFTNATSSKASSPMASAAVSNISAKMLSVASTSVSRSTPMALPAPKLAASTSASSTSSHSNPFSKTDRRAKAERVSRLKAMRARAQKGLLSEEEKLILATEEEEMSKDKDCVVM